MRANIPRSFASLSMSEKQKIADFAQAQLNKDMMIILDIYLKMSCAVLHNAFGFGEKRLKCYLGNYRRLFKQHRKLVKRGEQLPVLDEQMRKIFRKDGYPDEFFKRMFEDWSVTTNGQDESVN